MVITQEEYEKLSERARRRGFTSPDAYLRALVDADAEEHAVPALFDDPPEVKFKRAFRDALRGDTLSEDEFWQAVSHSSNSTN